MAAVMAAPEAVAAPSSLLLLVVGGECGCPGLLAHILEELERGGAAGTGAAATGRGGASGWGWGFRRAGVRVGRSDPGRNVPGGRVLACQAAPGLFVAARVAGSGWGRGGLGPVWGRAGGASDSGSTGSRGRPGAPVGAASPALGFRRGAAFLF